MQIADVRRTGVVGTVTHEPGMFEMARSSRSQARRQEPRQRQEPRHQPADQPKQDQQTRRAEPSPQESRGRGADSPKQIPKPGWRDIMMRVKAEMTNDNISIVAAGVAFYAILAIFPAMAAAVTIYALVLDPAQIQQQVSAVSGMIPPGARNLLMSQLNSLASNAGGALSVGLIVSLLITLWSASKAMTSLITSLNIVYDEEETRGMIKPYLLSIGLTIAAIIFAFVTLALIVAVPAVVGNLGLPGWIQALISLAKWVLLAGAIMLALAVLYRYGPSREQPRWEWASAGAIIAAILWLVGSALFSIYVGNFGSYNKTYGSFAGIIILLLWFNLSAYAVLIGAEINAEMERQTKADTTTGKPTKKGRRGAYSADTVGEKP